MKKKLIQLLQDASIQDPAGNSYEQRVIADNDFSDLASDILRLFNEEKSETNRAMKKQKFVRGNIIKIEGSDHAVILDSAEHNAGCLNNSFKYSLMFEDGSTACWFKEDVLSFIEAGGEHIIDEYKKPNII